MKGEKLFRVELYTNFLFPGIILEGDAYSEKGEKIHDSNIPFTTEEIEKIKKRGIKRIYYDRPALIMKEKTKNPTIPKEELEKAIDISKEVEKAVQNKSMLPEKAIDEMVSGFIDNISKSEGTVLNLLELKEFDEYTYAHSINVCLISILFAKRLSYNEKGLKIIGAGALLHDIGKTMVPKKILKKPTALTPEESKIIKKHPIFGYEIIRAQSNFGSLIQKIVLLHHEKYNGKGYPFGMRGEEIGEIAQIIGIADTFDAITSEHPYKAAKPYWYALSIINKSSGINFAPRIARTFVQEMPRFLTEEEVFPKGSFVVLNTGEVGEVIDYRYPQTIKPVVNLYINARKEVVRYPIPIDLHFDDTRYIENMLEEETVLEKLQKIKKSFEDRKISPSVSAEAVPADDEESEQSEKNSKQVSEKELPAATFDDNIIKPDKDLFEENESELK